MSDSDSRAMLDAEFALRSLAIEALSICHEAGMSEASIYVTPEYGEDDDWWKVSYSKDGKIHTSACFLAEEL